jgi:hypothetical protein
MRHSSLPHEKAGKMLFAFHAIRSPTLERQCNKGSRKRKGLEEACSVETARARTVGLRKD